VPFVVNQSLPNLAPFVPLREIFRQFLRRHL
jgi:hypothetical protein